MKFQKRYLYAFCAVVSRKWALELLILSLLCSFNNCIFAQANYNVHQKNGSKASIITHLTSENFCAGSGININFEASGNFSGDNTFIAQMSNASGSFDVPLELGRLNGSKGSEIFVSIPSNINSGSGYRIRVISTSPAFAGGDNNFNITIKDVPKASISVHRPANFSLTNPVVLTASSGELFTWSNGAQSKSITVAEPGTYSVKVANVAGCGTVSAAVVIAADPVNFETVLKPAGNDGNNGAITIQATGGSGIYEYSIDGGITYSAGNTFENLKNGSYQVMVRSNGFISKMNEVLMTAMKASEKNASTGKSVVSTIHRDMNKQEKGSVVVKPAIAFTNTVKVYPNPASDNFAIAISNMQHGKAQVLLTSLEGYVILQQWINVVANTQAIPISLKAPLNGIYIVKVISGKDIQTTKVLLKG